MNENTAKLIEQLAAKLGTTSAYLWSVLIKQAPVAATVTVMQTIIITVLSYLLFKVYKKISKETEDEYGNENSLAVVLIIILAVVFGIILLILFCSIGDVINGYFNPEFWAIDYVMGKLKSN